MKVFDYMKLRCADALADEVAALVKRKVIDSRAPAADALLDYRDPPQSPRSDRLVELERQIDHLNENLNLAKLREESLQANLIAAHEFKHQIGADLDRVRGLIHKVHAMAREAMPYESSDHYDALRDIRDLTMGDDLNGPR